jgi:hypothetical protein
MALHRTAVYRIRYMRLHIIEAGRGTTSQQSGIAVCYGILSHCTVS